MYSYLLILIFTFLGAIAGYNLKKAISGVEKITDVVKHPFLYYGLFLYTIAAAVNILVLSKLSYTVVLPLTAITYIWSLLLAYYFLEEKITILKIIGVLLIIMGSLLIAITSG
ncbi:MAG: EamA family transporter [Halanaerobiaceae bacterium]